MLSEIFPQEKAELIAVLALAITASVVWLTLKYVVRWHEKIETYQEKDLKIKTKIWAICNGLAATILVICFFGQDRATYKLVLWVIAAAGITTWSGYFLWTVRNIRESLRN